MSVGTFLKSILASVAIAGFGVLPVLSVAPTISYADAVRAPAGVGPEAISALGRMSKTLAARQFSFAAHTFRAYAGPNGEMLHIEHTAKIVFRRPDRLSVDVTGDDGSTRLAYDSKSLVIYAAEQKKYASIPVAGGIDAALDAAQEQARIDMPLAALLTADADQSLLAGVTSGGQVGAATIDGILCRHFYFVQAADDLEWELWLEDNDRALPRRVVVTYRSLPGRPIFIAELSNWDLSRQAPDSEFEFNPPPGVERVDLAGNATTPSPATK